MNKRKDKKRRSTEWKNELFSGLVELLFGLGAMGIGLGIAFLLSYEIDNNFSFELFWFIGAIVLIAILGVAALIARKRKRKRWNLLSDDVRLNLIYDELKDEYNVTLTTVTKNINGEMIEITAICGENSTLTAEFCIVDDLFVFYLKGFDESGQKIDRHGSFTDVAPFIRFIENFMSDSVEK